MLIQFFIGNLDIKYGDWVSLRNNSHWLRCRKLCAEVCLNKCYFTRQNMVHGGRFYVHDANGNIPNQPLVKDTHVTLKVPDNLWVNCIPGLSSCLLFYAKVPFLMKKQRGDAKIRAGDKIYFMAGSLAVGGNPDSNDARVQLVDSNQHTDWIVHSGNLFL